MRIKPDDTGMFNEENQEDFADNLAYMEKMEEKQAISGVTAMHLEDIKTEAATTPLDLPEILSDEVLTEKLIEITGQSKWLKWSGYGDPVLHPGEPVEIGRGTPVMDSLQASERPPIYQLYLEVQKRLRTEPEAEALTAHIEDQALIPSQEANEVADEAARRSDLARNAYRERWGDKAAPNTQEAVQEQSTATRRSDLARNAYRERWGDEVAPAYRAVTQEAALGQSTFAEQVGRGAHSVFSMARDCLCGLAVGIKSAMLARVAEAKEDAGQRPYSSMIASPDEFNSSFQTELQQRTYRWERANKHCLLLEERMLTAEKLADALSTNPIIAGYTAKLHSAAGEASPELLAEFRKSLDDPYNPYGAAAKNDIRTLFSSLEGIEKDMDKTASACAKVHSTEKLEARVHNFLQGMHNRPEGALISEPDTGESLKERVSGLFDKLKQVFSRIKSVFAKEKTEEAESEGLTPMPA